MKKEYLTPKINERFSFETILKHQMYRTFEILKIAKIG